VTPPRSTIAQRVPARLRSKAGGGVKRLARVTGRLQDPGAVAITFDDGPDPEFTPRVLEVLQRHQAPATFFIVGRRARRHPALVQRIVAAGHAVGSHTDTHADGWTLSPAEYARELWRGRRALESVTGRRETEFRPPKGYLPAQAALTAAALGIRPWMWSANPKDWRPGITAAEIVGSMPALTGGEIVLLHDGIELPLAPEAEDRSATVEALPAIIDAARSRGLRLERVDLRR
jgi:peptidoglycan/xylan/chitin deacetylase (PgdA/CDA1 family)